MSTRRQALQASGAAIALAGLPRTTWAASPAGPPSYLSRSAWPGQVGAEVGAGLRLETVTDVAQAAGRGLVASEDAFVLTFSGAVDARLEQGIHRLGEAELFLVPVGRPGARQTYEAVIDRAASSRAPDPAPALPAVAIAAPVAASDDAEARFAFLRSLRMRRARPGLQVTVRVTGMRAVSVRVERDGVVLARGRSDVRGRKVTLGLRPRVRLARGRYDVVVTGLDGGGVPTAVRRSVTLR